jgi:carbohydrate kinase (thermoresistant glucokinase family)
MSSPPLVIVVMGVSGSGKTAVGSRLATALGYTFHDADDFHPPENVARMQSGQPLDDGLRGPWLDRLAMLVDESIAQRQGIVLACSALARRYRDRIGTGRSEVRLVHLDGDEQLIRQRMERRTGHFMPATLLASQLAALEKPTADEAAITVAIAAPPDRIVASIVAALEGR